MNANFVTRTKIAVAKTFRNALFQQRRTISKVYDEDFNLEYLDGDKAGKLKIFNLEKFQGTPTSPESSAGSVPGDSGLDFALT